jgi:hypothetical protein
LLRLWALGSGLSLDHAVTQSLCILQERGQRKLTAKGNSEGRTMDLAQIVVTVSGLALIVCVLFFFFGPKRHR